MTSRGPNQISVRGEVYDKLKVAAHDRGVTIASLVEAACLPVPDRLEVKGKVTELPPKEPGRSFTCAICARSSTGVPTREPLGRDDAMVDVCASCSSDVPQGDGR